MEKKWHPKTHKTCGMAEHNGPAGRSRSSQCHWPPIDPAFRKPFQIIDSVQSFHRAGDFLPLAIKMMLKTIVVSLNKFFGADYTGSSKIAGPILKPLNSGDLKILFSFFPGPVLRAWVGSNGKLVSINPGFAGEIHPTRYRSRKLQRPSIPVSL